MNAPNKQILAYYLYPMKTVHSLFSEHMAAPEGFRDAVWALSLIHI